MLGAFVLGAVVMFFRKTGVEAEYRRIAYMWRLVWLSCGFTLALLALHFMPALAEKGGLALLLLVVIAAFATMGAGYVHAAAGRARHIDGTPNLTYLAFIPIVSLYLALKPRAPCQPEETRSDRGADIGLLVLMALPLWICSAVHHDLGSWKEITRRTTDRLIERSADPVQAAHLISYRFQQEYTWRKFMRFDLVHQEVTGPNISLTYRIPRARTRFDVSEAKETFAKRCAASSYQRLLQTGVEVTLSLVNEAGHTASELSTTDTTCVG